MKVLCVFISGDAARCATHDVIAVADGRMGWRCPVAGGKVAGLNEPGLFGPLPPGIPANMDGCNVEHPAVENLLKAHDTDKALSCVYGPSIDGWDDGVSARRYLDDGGRDDYEPALLAAASLLASNRITPGDL